MSDTYQQGPWTQYQQGPWTQYQQPGAANPPPPPPGFVLDKPQSGQRVTDPELLRQLEAMSDDDLKRAYQQGAKPNYFDQFDPKPPKRIEFEGQIIEFPGEMSDSDIEAAMQRNYPAQHGKMRREVTDPAILKQLQGMSDEELIKSLPPGFVLDGPNAPQGGKPNYFDQFDAPDDPFARAALRTQRSVKHGAGRDMGQLTGAAVGALDPAVRQIAKGVPVIGSYLDEANAATGAALGMGDYDSNVAAQRAKDKQFETAHPYASTALQVGGGIASGVGAMRAAPGLANVAFGNVGSSIVPRMAAGAASGAAMGGAHGFGSGEGSLDNRLQEAGRGAMIGGVIGGAVPAVAAGVSAGVRGIANYGAAKATGQNLGVSAGAVRRVANDLQADDMAGAAIRNRADELGPDGMLLDYGRNLQGRAEALASMPGKSQNTVVGAVEGRVKGTADRLGQELDNALGRSPNIVAIADQIDKTYGAQIKPAYEAAMSAHPDVWDDTLQRLTRRPSIAKAINDAVSLAQESGDDIVSPFAKTNSGYVLQPGAKPNLKFWDYTKKSLDARIGALARNPDPDSAGKASLSALLETKRALIDHLDGLTGGAYKQARDLHADKVAMKEALENGTNIFKNNMLPEQFADMIEGMGAVERRAMAAGARRALERMKEVAPANISEGGRQVYRELLQGGPNGDTAQKLRMLLGDEAADTLTKAAQRETGFQSAYDTIRGNSRTTPRLNAQADMTPPTFNNQHATMTGILNRAPVAAVEKLFGYQMGQGMNRTRDEAARLLTARGGEAQRIAEGLANFNRARTSTGNNATNDLARALLMPPAITQAERSDVMRPPQPWRQYQR